MMESLLEGMQRNQQGRYVCSSVHQLIKIIEVLTFPFTKNQILWYQDKASVA